jgi:hypothetical protein
MPVFEVRWNVAFALKEFFDGRELQRPWSQSRRVVTAQVEAGGDDLLVITRMARVLFINRVAIEQRKQSDLFALELKAISNGVGDNSAEGPAEQLAPLTVPPGIP